MVPNRAYLSINQRAVFDMPQITLWLLLLLFYAERPVSALPGACGDLSFVSVFGETIVFCGPITSISTTELETLLQVNKEIETLRMSSPGGDPASGIEIARMIHAHDLRLVVFEECLSACAQYVFISAPIVFVEPDTVVAFHHTVSTNLKIISEYELEFDERMVRDMEKAARLEVEFYEELDLDVAFLSKPFARMQPTCIEREQTDPNRISMRGPYKTWTGSRAVLEGVRGRPVDGWWPSDRNDYFRVVNIRYPTLSSPRFFRYEESITTGDEDALHKLPWCKPRNGDR
jgi:hypothetical protein